MCLRNMGENLRIQRMLSQRSKVVKTDEHVKTINGVYHSVKGFCIAERKLSGFCLKPGSKHSDHFFRIGYGETDAELLFRHIETGYDASKKMDVCFAGEAEKFCIPMTLGVTVKWTFRTAWQIDKPGDKPRFISAYHDDSLREDR